METTKQFMAQIRARYHLTSDYQLAKFLGITRQRISGYKGRDVTLGDETALKVAEALELQPGYVLNCMAAERAKRPEVKKAWQRAAAALTSGATLLFLLAIFYRHGIDLEVISAGFLFLGNTHYTQIECVFPEGKPVPQAW